MGSNVPEQQGPYQSLLAAGRVLLQLAAMVLRMECARLSSTQCAGKCSPAASPVMCAVGHNQTAQELLGLEPPPIYSGFLALTRPPSRLQQTLLCPYRLFPMGQKREMFVRDWPSHKQGAGEDAGHKAGVEICWMTCGNLGKELRLSGDRSERTPGTKRLHPHSGRKLQRV